MAGGIEPLNLFVPRELMIIFLSEESFQAYAEGRKNERKGSPIQTTLPEIRVWRRKKEWRH